MTRALDRDGQMALMPGARAGLAARADFATIAQEAAQLIGLLIIDRFDLVDTELTDFGTRHVFAAAPLATRPATARTTTTRSSRPSRRHSLLILITHDVLRTGQWVNWLIGQLVDQSTRCPITDRPVA